MANDILLGDDCDLVFNNGDLVIGESEMQDVSIIIQMNQGDLKSDPIIGCNLMRHVKSRSTKQEIETIVKLHLKRDNKDYNELKNKIKYNLKTI